MLSNKNIPVLLMYLLFAAICALFIFQYKSKLTNRLSVMTIKEEINTNMWFYQEYIDAIKNPHSGISQEDPRLIQTIRDYFLLEPSKEVYHLRYPHIRDTAGDGQAKAIMELLKDMSNGFFVDCGAWSGEEYSNTLYMERFRNWTGLLVEGGSENFAVLKTKNRKAWLSNSCMSLNRYPEMVNFEARTDSLGGVTTRRDLKNIIKVQCLPFYSLLAALNRTSVDYFSLDVEGDEFKVLQTIPWHLVQIKTLTVEVVTSPPEISRKLKSFMDSKGYILHKILYRNGKEWDYVFYHPEYLGFIP